jgi:hypothetical protein
MEVLLEEEAWLLVRVCCSLGGRHIEVSAVGL